jgi:para-aminobenzoate synthetase component 2
VKRILVIDNYDSFVYTLNGYLQELGAVTTVVRNDDIPLDKLEETLREYDGILVSPGPGTPADAGVSIETVKTAARLGIPLLGVCLGHQAIGEAFGATVTNAEELMHGKTSPVTHDGSSFYANVPQPFTATRYHSLAVVDSTVPDDLVVTSRTAGGVTRVHRSLVFSSTPNRFSPRVATPCSETGSRLWALPEPESSRSQRARSSRTPFRRKPKSPCSRSV